MLTSGLVQARKHGAVLRPDAYEQVGPRRTFEGAVEQIADRLRLGELVEGDRLPSERELAAAMQISRPTLREAVRVRAQPASSTRLGSGCEWQRPALASPFAWAGRAWLLSDCFRALWRAWPLAP